MKEHQLFIKNRSILKNNMLEDYGYLFCQHCDKSNNGIETHHIVFRSECNIPELVHDIINLLLVCWDCHHNKFHKIKSTRNKYVLERGLNELFGRNVLIEL